MPGLGRTVLTTPAKPLTDITSLCRALTEVQPGLGQEAAEQAGPALHLSEPGLDQRGQLADVVLDEIGQRPFEV
jgi:hypothetical protein